MGKQHSFTKHNDMEAKFISIIHSLGFERGKMGDTRECPLTPLDSPQFLFFIAKWSNFIGSCELFPDLSCP